MQLDPEVESRSATGLVVPDIDGTGQLQSGSPCVDHSDHFVSDMSPVYAMAGNFSGAIDVGRGGGIDTKTIYTKATQIGGAMQLHAAKKMGKNAYDQTRIFGLSAYVFYCGVVRFEEKRSGGSSDVDIVLWGWHGLSSPRVGSTGFTGMRTRTYTTPKMTSAV
ncbi:hypothetical protein ACFL6M_04795 [Candidatus Eisenbacteria bacterium]|uniref:Uncharacterized protein n=1 Tax=Eiseniibacteriota bacterium TaxID=2212470 RepID=A0ABV6YL49_UNCEI